MKPVKTPDRGLCREMFGRAGRSLRRFGLCFGRCL